MGRSRPQSPGASADVCEMQFCFVLVWFSVLPFHLLLPRACREPSGAQPRLCELTPHPNSNALAPRFVHSVAEETEAEEVSSHSRGGAGRRHKLPWGESQGEACSQGDSGEPGSPCHCGFCRWLLESTRVTLGGGDTVTGEATRRPPDGHWPWVALPPLLNTADLCRSNPAMQGKPRCVP